MTHAPLALATMLAPLIAFAIALVGFRDRPAVAVPLAITGGVVSFVGSLWLLLDPPAAAELITYRWFTAGGVDITWGALLDGRSLLMGAIVGLITLGILVYSLGYMEHDPGKARFFAFLGLFEWSMLSFAYAPNLLQAFIFWELVGLASFLLIGFWYRKPSAVAASKKAFIMTRIGDVGMFVGLILLFSDVGTLDVLSINGLFDAAHHSGVLPAGLSQGRVELLAGLLFLGVMGKSAQFPLHTWLPDAMEGPTPVSALLHSATMVAAGVFLFARFQELFANAPGVMNTVLVIATFTVLLSASTAMVAQDMKKVLAYSSISQLGYMLIGLASGSLFAGLFHLTTHALFKALLFLTAGSYIHQFGTNDMVAMGRGGGRKMRLTTAGLWAGGLALAGVPIWAGFWSKEAVLGAALEHGHPIVYGLAVFGALLTAYYTFRMIFLVTRPDDASGAVPEEPIGTQPVHHDPAHIHESPPMAGVIAALAVLATVAGLPFVADWMGRLLGASGEVHHAALTEMLLPLGVVAAGVAWAWIDFGREGSPQRGFLAWLPSVEAFFRAGWHLDALYKRTAVALTYWVAKLAYFTETRGFDGAGDAVAQGALRAGAGTAKTQTGRLPIYLGTAVVVVAVAALYIGFTGSH